MAKNERTGKAIGRLAAKTLRDPKATKREKRLAGSALTQRPNRRRRKRRAA